MQSPNNTEEKVNPGIGFMKNRTPRGREARNRPMTRKFQTGGLFRQPADPL